MEKRNPQSAIRNPQSALPQLPPRPADAHKGTFGRLLVVGGSDEMLGAPVLAGTAALRMGAGLVQIAVPRANLAASLSITPELIGLGLASAKDDDRLLEAAQHADALVIGPGMGQSPAAARRLSRLVRLAKPAVIDADALNLLAKSKRWPAAFKLSAVLTPHPGEMARLAKLLGKTTIPSDEPGRIALATLAARTFNQTIILKGHRTVVADGTRVYVNTTGDSTLAKAGSGDVLSGMLGCLLAQKMSPFDAAVLAVHLHGKAGELAGQRLGQRSALARDVIETIPQAIPEFTAATQRP